MAKTYDFDDFCQITEMLRKKEGGCPWDLSQTHQSLKPYMLSETVEAVAIRSCESCFLPFFKAGSLRVFSNF